MNKYIHLPYKLIQTSEAQQALIEAQQSTISTLMTRMEALENKLNKQEETNI